MSSEFPEDMRIFRDMLGNAILRGRGLEIGAGNVPLRFTNPNTRSLYVDMASKNDLIKNFNFPTDWNEADLIEDGTELPSVATNSVEYIAACHVLEHCQDPVRTLETWFSKITLGGILYIAIPHRDHGFDKNRPLTSIDHIFKDFNNSKCSEDEHLQEWAEVVNGMTDKQIIETYKLSLKKKDYRIHYHVWDTDSFLDFLLTYRKRLRPFDLEFFGRNVNEVIAILRKK